MKFISSIALTGCLALSPCSRVTAGDLTRMLAESFADTQIALADGSADIVMIGDSLTVNIAPKFRVNVQTAGGYGGIGYLSAAQTNTFAFPWVVVPGNTDQAPYHGLNGMWATYIPPGEGPKALRVQDRFARMHFMGERGGGSFDLLPECGLPTTISTAANNRIVEVTYQSPASGPFEVNVVPRGDGEVTYLGMIGYALTPGSRLHMVANGGWGVQNYLNRSWTFDEQMKLINPDMFIVMLGQNDRWMNPETFRLKVVDLVRRLREHSPQAEIVLVSSYDSGSVMMADMAQAMDAASLQEQTGFLNLYEIAGPYQDLVARGMIDPDGVHFTSRGSEFMSNIIWDALLTDGQSLLPCADLDFNNDFVYPDASDMVALIQVYGGGKCPGEYCDSIDFNDDGVYPDLADLTAYFRVFGGGACEEPATGRGLKAERGNR